MGELRRRCDGNWEIYNGDTSTVIVESGMSATGTLERTSTCPLDAGQWRVEGTWTLAKISLTCSLGRNKCPDDFPYSYDYGQKCCSSPFKYDPNAALTSTQPTTILKPTDTTDCYGATEDCKYMKASNNIKNPCRTNLDVLSNFKGSQSKDVSYPAIKLCTDGCNPDCPNNCVSVNWLSSLETA